MSEKPFGTAGAGVRSSNIGGARAPLASPQSPRWAMWRALPDVQIWQAVALSLNAEPTDEMRKQVLFSTLPPRGLLADIKERLALCRHGVRMAGPIRPQGRLWNGMTEDPQCAVLLAEVAAFLKLAGFTVADEMHAGIASPARDIAARPAPGSPAAAEPAPTVAAPSAAPDWKDQARAEARRVRKERAALGRFPSLEDLGDEVARLFRDRGITGPNGHALTGAYIKRHALQGHGITTDTDRLKATLNTRGK